LYSANLGLLRNAPGLGHLILRHVGGRRAGLTLDPVLAAALTTDKKRIRGMENIGT
jgi:hypothetical protein